MRTGTRTADPIRRRTSGEARPAAGSMRPLRAARSPFIVAVSAIGLSVAAGAALAQGGVYVEPSIALTEVYDDNVFVSSGPKDSDFITRITPGIRAGYRSQRMELEGRYDFDAEFYAENDQLNSSQARQNGSFDYSYEASRALTMSMDGAYIKTENPDELTPDTGLERGRARAERASIRPSAAYRFGPRTSANTSYEFIRDKIENDFDTDTHRGIVELERRVSPRDTGSAEYEINRFVFENGDRTTAHIFRLGWERQFTPRTSFEFRGGPRFTENEVEADVTATLRHRFQRGDLGLTYSRTQTTVIGEQGPVESQTFMATAGYSVTRKLRLSAVPSYQITEQGAFDADVYRLDLEARYQFNKYASLLGAWRYSLQEGTLSAVGGDIERNVILVSLELTYPPRRTTALPAGETEREQGTSRYLRTIR